MHSVQLMLTAQGEAAVLMAFARSGSAPGPQTALRFCPLPSAAAAPYQIKQLSLHGTALLGCCGSLAQQCTHIAHWLTPSSKQV